MNYLTKTKINGPDKDVGLDIKIDFEDVLFDNVNNLEYIRDKLDSIRSHVCSMLESLLHGGGLTCVDVHPEGDSGISFKIHGERYTFYDYSVLYDAVFPKNGELSEFIMILGENADVLCKSLYDLKLVYHSEIKWEAFKNEDM